ncbi:MAG TPA: sulfurtransferase TusA family protein [Myxococcales bacterium]
METIHLDARGTRCPAPTLRLTAAYMRAQAGDIIELVADCERFEHDVREWCAQMKKALLWLRDEGQSVKRCQIRM